MFAFLFAHFVWVGLHVWVDFRLLIGSNVFCLIIIIIIFYSVFPFFLGGCHSIETSQYLLHPIYIHIQDLEENPVQWNGILVGTCLQGAWSNPRQTQSCSVLGMWAKHKPFYSLCSLPPKIAEPNK